MRFSAVAFLAGAQLAVAVTTSMQVCNADNCLRAIRATNSPSRALDCQSYFRATVTPATITNTQTFISTVTANVVNSFITTTTSTATTTTNTGLPIVKRDGKAWTDPYGLASTSPALLVRDVTLSPSSIPSYASACSGSAHYSSACSCVGATHSTITVIAPITVTSITRVTSIAITTATTSTSTSIALATATGVLPGYYYLGCYEDEQINYPFVASGGYTNPNPLTLEICADICIQDPSNTYFGVYFSSYCICGSSFDFTVPDDPSFCNVPCNGDTSGTTFCGGNGGLSGYPVWDFYQYEGSS